MNLEKNKILILALSFIIIICIAVVGTSVLKYTVKKPIIDAKSEYNPKSIEDITKDSETVVQRKIMEKQSIATLGTIDFLISSLFVEQTLKGDVSSGPKINIIQTKNLDIDPPLSPKEDVLLFLVKYDGAINIDNAYCIKGLYQGNYRIENDKLHASKQSDGNITSEINDKKFDDIKAKIETVH